MKKKKKMEGETTAEQSPFQWEEDDINLISLKHIKIEMFILLNFYYYYHHHHYYHYYYKQTALPPLYPSSRWLHETLVNLLKRK